MTASPGGSSFCKPLHGDAEAVQTRFLTRLFKEIPVRLLRVECLAETSILRISGERETRIRHNLIEICRALESFIRTKITVSPGLGIRSKYE